MSKYKTVVAVFVFASLAACGRAEGPAATATVEAPLVVVEDVAQNCSVEDESGTIAIAPGLNARIIQPGYGRAAVIGDYADTNVWLWLFDEEAEDRHGKVIWESGANVFQFQLGSGQVIKGWDMGVPCMLEGETRELVVAGDLAYGSAGRGEIPPNATLIFNIELLRVKAPE
jgi:FKBP-type peptidyl-prolyl cis-trans isomerase FkpA